MGVSLTIGSRMNLLRLNCYYNGLNPVVHYKFNGSMVLAT